MIKRWARTLVVTASLLAAGPAFAVERLGWDDLAPRIDESEDPLQGMSSELRTALFDVYWSRSVMAEGQADEQIMQVEADGLKTLAAANLDADALLREVEAFDRKITINNETLVQELDGRVIQIPGYALPLEYTGTTMTEFLLVPYVGACIHTPPPPTNQIVYVSVPEGYESQGLFTPVWVTGQISADPSSRELSFVDGTSDISVGYNMAATVIEPFEEFPQ